MYFWGSSLIFGRACAREGAQEMVKPPLLIMLTFPNNIFLGKSNVRSIFLGRSSMSSSMFSSFHACQLHLAQSSFLWHLGQSSFLCFLPLPRSWLNPDHLRVQLGLSFTLITQGNLLSRAFPTRPCSLCVCSDLDIIRNDAVSDFCHLTVISYLPTVALNPMTPTLPHCRIVHTLESFHFSFLAALP